MDNEKVTQLSREELSDLVLELNKKVSTLTDKLENSLDSKELKFKEFQKLTTEKLASKMKTLKSDFQLCMQIYQMKKRYQQDDSFENFNQQQRPQGRRPRGRRNRYQQQGGNW